MGLVAAVFLGLCLGSFATALSYRLPRGISMVTKTHSSCPACGHDLGARDLVPLFSWLLLKGKCRYCGTRIGARYPLTELGTLILCVAFYYGYGLTPQGFVMFALAPVLASIVAIDLEHKIIPDVLNIAVLVLGVAALLLGAPDAGGALAAAGGAAIYAGGAWALRLVFSKAVKREAMGLGDVKFFGAAGFWLGPSGAEAAGPFLVLSGALGVALALVWRKTSGEKEFPFGPALAIAFAVLLAWLRPFSP